MATFIEQGRVGVRSTDQHIAIAITIHISATAYRSAELIARDVRFELIERGCTDTCG